MTRKITELEQLLLDDGWYLIRKNYEGKHSEKVSFYEYAKCVLYEESLGFQAVVKLNAERNKIINIGIPNVNIAELDKESEEELHSRFFFLQDYVAKLINRENLILENEKRTLKDLELSPRQRYEIEKIVGTNDLEKIGKTKNLVVLLLSKLPKKVDVLYVLKVLAREGLCREI